MVSNFDGIVWLLSVRKESLESHFGGVSHSLFERVEVGKGDIVPLVDWVSLEAMLEQHLTEVCSHVLLVFLELPFSPLNHMASDGL